MVLLSGIQCLFADKEPKEHKIFDLLYHSNLDMETVAKRIEKQMKGKIYRAELEREGKWRYVFELSALINDEGMIIIVDPRSGQVINATSEGFWDGWSNSSEKEAVKKATVPMSQAASIAQKACQGKAIEVRLEINKENILYEFETINRQGRCEVLVDAQTGDFFKTPSKHPKRPRHSKPPKHPKPHKK